MYYLNAYEPLEQITEWDLYFYSGYGSQYNPVLKDLYDISIPLFKEKVTVNSPEIKVKKGNRLIILQRERFNLYPRWPPDYLYDKGHADYEGHIEFYRCKQ